jgi:transcriptional regulator with XRE-family HTH domain/Zn-dependent peptidase ImmA (M78 family)
MDGKTLGVRIAEARKALDLTQEHLANRVGIDRTALGLIENGKRKVSAVELVDLAAALDVPLAWFVRDALPAVASRRAEAGPSHELTARLDRELELFSGDVASLVVSGVLAAVDDRPTWTVPRTHDDSEKVAQQVREHLGAGTGPLLDIAGVAERFGLYSCSLALGAGGADGALVEVADGVAAAVIDGDAQPARRRMSLAHELGHWLFGDAYDAGADDAERMINSFAIYLLAPRAGVKQLWNQFRTESARDQAIRVAAAYRISWSAAVLHLLHLNLISDDQRWSLENHIPVAGEFARLRIIRGTEELRPPSVSPGMVSAVLEAYTDRRLTAARTLELLRGQMQQEDLPPQRVETAADYANL